MYEANLSSITAAQADDSGAMRAFEWDELVAKLAAARDLRGLFAAARGDSPGSFAAGAAHAFAIAEKTSSPNKGSVNPDALGAGKRPGARTVAAAVEAGDCDREMR